MKPLGKVMLTPKGDYNSGTTYDVLDLVRYDHKSWISLKQQTGVVPTHGADWQLYTEDGNGIVNVSYVGVDPTDPDGLTDIYEISFTNTTPFQFKIRNGKDGSGGGGGASSWSDLRNKPFNTLGTDFKVDSNVLKLADAVIDKLSKLNTAGVLKDYVLTADGNGGTSWEKAKGGISEDDLYKEFSNLPTRTEDGYKFVEVTDNTKIMSAKATSEYSNKFVTRIIVPLPSGKDTIGVWQDKPSDEWETNPSLIKNYMLVLPQLYEADDEELEISIKFDTTTSEPLVLGGWQYINQVVNTEGENCGAICIKCANIPSVDAKVIIDIERVRTETFNVEWTWG